MRERPAADQIQHRTQLVVAVDVIRRAVTAGLKGLDLIYGQAEQEEVLRSRLFANLDVGPVEGADRQGAIDHELHVAGARRFLAGGGDLLGYVRRRIDQVRVLHVEIRDERNLEELVDFGVVVDGLPDRVDQLDDPLGQKIAGSRLTAKDKGPRRN